MDARDNPNVEVRFESVRGCGFRDKPGAMYFTAEFDNSFSCGRFPIPLTLCPCCGHGIRLSRGIQWINARKFLDAAPPCKTGDSDDGLAHCMACPTHNLLATEQLDQSLMIRIGEKHYPTPESFIIEARDGIHQQPGGISLPMGISRRITSKPNGFELGKTWVFLAHKKAIKTAEITNINQLELFNDGPQPNLPGLPSSITLKDDYQPGIFFAFQPTAIEVIVTDETTEEELKGYIEKGYTPIYIVKNQTTKPKQGELI